MEHLSNVPQTYFQKSSPLRPQLWSVSFCYRLFLKYKAVKPRENQKCTILLKIDLENLTVKVPCIYIHQVLTIERKIWSVSLYGQPFPRCKIVENGKKNRKCTE